MIGLPSRSQTVWSFEYSPLLVRRYGPSPVKQTCRCAEDPQNASKPSDDGIKDAQSTPTYKML